jgi:hypothetical protein
VSNPTTLWLLALLPLLVFVQPASASEPNETAPHHTSGAASHAWRLDELPPNDLEPYRRNRVGWSGIRAMSSARSRILTPFDPDESVESNLRSWKDWHAGRLDREDFDLDILSSVDLIP